MSHGIAPAGPAISHPPARTNASAVQSAFGSAALTALFTVFLVPVQIDGISVNYSFLLIPLAAICITGRVKRPAPVFPPIIALYALIFVAASAYQLGFVDHSVRRTASFVLFMSVFSYVFVGVSSKMIECFKTAIVLASVLMSLYAVYLFFVLGGSSTLGFEAKDLVGSQRFGFVYLMAFWLVYFHQGSSWTIALLRYAVMVVLLAGLLLTFSRSSIVSLVASVTLFALVSGLIWLARPGVRGLRHAVLGVVGIAVFVALLYALLPLAFSFFDERLLALLQNPAAISADLADIYSSGGTRIYLLREIVSFSLANPLTGAGYLGVWILPGLGGDFVGSAHNQYADVLFRTGWLGLIAYLYLLLLLLEYLHASQKALFWGLIAVLCYGVFHETFKESQGGFLLAFLLGMLSEALQNQRVRVGSVFARAG